MCDELLPAGRRIIAGQKPGPSWGTARRPSRGCRGFAAFPWPPAASWPGLSRARQRRSSSGPGQRAPIEIKGANRAFDAPGRMLAVYIETSPERTLIFRNREDPTITIRFLAGFRELCEAGLVMHHIYHEFSLTREGMDQARASKKPKSPRCSPSPPKRDSTSERASAGVAK